MVHGKGINNMPKGWTKADKWNYRVYQVWRSMIQRCYSEKFHERCPTYKNCTVCERWLKLSNFVEDICKIDGYEYWRDNPNQKISLDKDIKSNGQNRCYCLEQCMFVNNTENVKQANKTRKYDGMKGENHPMYGKGYLMKGEKNPMYGRTGEKAPMYGVHRYGEKAPRTRKVVSVDPFTKLPVFTWQYVRQATNFYGIDGKTLNYYLKGKSKKGHLYNGFLWYYADEWEQLQESLI